MRPCRAVFVAVLLCFTNGCVLGVGWLPDSSGFVFTTPEGQLVAYDIATKKQRVVLRDPAAATTCWPALSPSGKRIALAHLVGAADKNEAVLQFVVCDLQGKVDFRSDELKLTSLTGKDYEYSTQVTWSPDEKKLVAHGQGNPNGGTGFDNAVLFDLATKKMQIWEQHVPAYFGGTPVRSDGAGFLLADLKSNDDVRMYLWVDWTGTAQKIAVPKRGQQAVLISPWTALGDSRWDGTNAILTFAKHRFVVDTKKLQQTVKPEPDTMIGKEEIQMRATLASGLELLMLSHDDGNNRGAAIRIVARKKGDAALTEVIAPIRDEMVLLSASPDRKTAIIRTGYGYRGKKRDTIYVLNDAGKLHNTIRVVDKQ